MEGPPSLTSQPCWLGMLFPTANVKCQGKQNNREASLRNGIVSFEEDDDIDWEREIDPYNSSLH